MINWNVYIQQAAIALLFTLISWTIVDQLLVEISFIKYFFVELIFVLSQKVYNFTIKSLNLEL